MQDRPSTSPARPAPLCSRPALSPLQWAIVRRRGVVKAARRPHDKVGAAKGRACRGACGRNPGAECAHKCDAERSKACGAQQESRRGAARWERMKTHTGSHSTRRTWCSTPRCQPTSAAPTGSGRCRCPPASAASGGWEIGEEMCSTWPGLWHERLDARGTCKGACLGPPWARCDVVRRRITGTRKARFPLPQKTHLHHLPQRAHGAQLLHVRHGELHGAVHLLVRGEAAQAVAYGRVRHVLLHAQGPQHIAGL